MLISSLISCAFLVQSAICSSGIQQDPPSINEKSSNQLSKDTGMHKYNHPLLPESNEETGTLKEKSINITEQNHTPLGRTRSRGIRRKEKPSTSTLSSEIPVQVIYDTAPTTVRSYINKPTNSPLDRSTRVFIRRNTNENINIRQISATSNIDTPTVTDNVLTVTGKDKRKVSSTTEFPKRSRASYFKKQPVIPTPKVKILEEKNFVYAHSGNFHYSFLGGDGTQISGQGSLKSYDNNKTGEAVSGSVFYKGMDGNDYSLSYTADENGYRPVGAHLPTPPPIPPAIVRALKYIADKSTPSPLAKSE